MRKLKLRILLALILLLPLVMVFHIQYNKQQMEDVKSGKIQSEDVYVPASDIHPESAYLWSIPYVIVEVCAIVFYRLYKDDQLHP